MAECHPPAAGPAVNCRVSRGGTGRVAFGGTHSSAASSMLLLCCWYGQQCSHNDSLTPIHPFQLVHGCMCEASPPEPLLPSPNTAGSRPPQKQSHTANRMAGLTEAYLKDILRPPPTGAVPKNVAHIFQSSPYTYFVKRAIPKHWYLAAGFGFTVTLYGVFDGLRDSGKKASYDAAVMEGKQPCEFEYFSLVSVLSGSLSGSSLSQDA